MRPADCRPAAEWDTPAHRASAKQAADAILAHLHELNHDLPENIERPLHQWDVLEIGCGTGLLSTFLAPQVGSLLGVDTSKGMMEVFTAKTRAHPNMSGRVMLLERPEQLNGQRFDLITSNLLLRASAHRAGR